MGIGDTLEKIGSWFEPKFTENDETISKLYVAIKTAEKNMENYNASIEYLKKRNPVKAKEMEAAKLQNKAATLSALKKKINNILREF